MLCYVMSYHIISYHVMSCHVMSCHVMSCHVMSCHVMSCHVMSCHVMLLCIYSDGNRTQIWTCMAYSGGDDHVYFFSQLMDMIG
jgi:hypothetical protein